MIAAALVAAALFPAGCSKHEPARPASFLATDDSVTVFDHHVHVLSPALIERWKAIGVPFSKPDYAYSDPDSLLKFNPADGMFLVSMAYLWTAKGFSTGNERANVERENDYVARLARRAPTKFFPFCAVDPLVPWAVDELRRCRRDLGMYGVKIQLGTSGVDLTDPRHLARLREVFAAASAEGMPILLHVEQDHEHADARPEAAARILIDSLLVPSPPLELFLAHLGTASGYTATTRATLHAFTDALGLSAEIRKHRLWFDLSAVALTEGSDEIPPLTPEDYADLASDLRALGLERVVFGTDYPAFNTVAYLDLLEKELPLSREELIGIAGNALPKGFR